MHTAIFKEKNHFGGKLALNFSVFDHLLYLHIMFDKENIESASNISENELPKPQETTEIETFKQRKSACPMASPHHSKNKGGRKVTSIPTAPKNKPNLPKEYVKLPSNRNIYLPFNTGPNSKNP